MKKRSIIFIIIFILTVSIFLYTKYLKEKKVVQTESKNSDDISYNSNIIEDVFYSSTDAKGNEYIIKAIQGEIDYKQTDIILSLIHI